MDSKSRGLFEIHAINLDTDEIVFHQKVIASGEKEALFESNLKETLKEQGISRDDIHLIVKEIGQVPAKEKAKTVKIIGQIGKTILGKEN